uniref:BURP domain-containing protein n=1 Tax=Setaria digitata TaxID=48799 RepID=A0A915PIA0_9BILA
MLKSMKKVIIIFAANIFVVIQGQLLQRTPNIASDLGVKLSVNNNKLTNISSNTSQASRISLKVERATSMPFTLVTSDNIQQPIHVKPLHLKSKLQQNDFKNLQLSAPRAKPYYFPAVDSAKPSSIMQMINNSVNDEIHPGQFDSSAKLSGSHKLPIFAYQNDALIISQQHERPIHETLKIHPLKRNNHTTQTKFATLSSHDHQNPLSLPLTATAAPMLFPAPSTLPSGGTVESGAVVPVSHSISSHSRWFNETVPSLGNDFFLFF